MPLKEAGEETDCPLASLFFKRLQRLEAGLSADRSLSQRSQVRAGARHMGHLPLLSRMCEEPGLKHEMPASNVNPEG